TTATAIRAVFCHGVALLIRAFAEAAALAIRSTFAVFSATTFRDGVLGGSGFARDSVGRQAFRGELANFFAQLFVDGAERIVVLFVRNSVAVDVGILGVRNSVAVHVVVERVRNPISIEIAVGTALAV